MRMFDLAPALLLGGLAGCGDDSGPGAGGTGGSGGETASTTGGGGSGGAANGGGGSAGSGGEGGAAADIEIAWYACPFETGQNGECAKIQVPLDWNEPGGKTIQVFVKRVKAPVQPARGQVWILQGGPGGSGTSIEFYGPRFNEMAPDLDVYFPDHRGTGISAEMDCPDLNPLPSTTRPLDPALVEAAVPDCLDALTAQHGDGLKHFSAAAAGRDLGELIERTRGPSDEVYVHGVSYGTRWAHRYLQQFPSQASGVVLDSIVGEPSAWLDFDKGIDAVGKLLLEACAGDAFCSAKMGVDPLVALETLLDDVDGGHCPTSFELGRDDYKALFAAVVVLGPLDRALLPALIYRAQRCDPTDQAVLENLYEALENGPSEYFSAALHFNVVNGELVESPVPSLAELAAEEETLLISSLQMAGYRAAYELWPRYEAGPLDGNFVDTSTPILMMNSPVDAQTTHGPATAFASNYTGEHQTFVEVPYSSHAVLSGSFLPDGTTCGAALVAQFLNAPTLPIDTSCTEQVLPHDFEQVGYSFGAGTIDVWDNAMTFTGPPQPLSGTTNALERLVAARASRLQVGGAK